MGRRVKSIIPAVGMLFVIGFAAIAVTRQAQGVKTALPESAGDLSVVKVVEIKNAGGQTVLSGSVTFRTDPDGEVEGLSTLTAAAGQSGPTGDAEIEISNPRNGVRKQELEIEVNNLTPSTNFSVHLDGKQVASFTSNAKGAAEVELKNQLGVK